MVYGSNVSPGIVDKSKYAAKTIYNNAKSYATGLKQAHVASATTRKTYSSRYGLIPTYKAVKNIFFGSGGGGSGNSANMSGYVPLAYSSDSAMTAAPVKEVNVQNDDGPITV